MLSNDAFRPSQPTFAISAPTSSPPAGVNWKNNTTADPAAGGDIRFEISNLGPNDVWVGYGPSSAAAQANAVAPTPGAPQQAILMPHGTVKVYTFSGQTFFSALSVGTTSQTIYLSPGDGI